MTSERSARQKWFGWIRLSVSGLVGLTVLLAMPLSFNLAQAATVSTLTTQPGQISADAASSALPDIQVNTTGRSSIVFETGRSRVLYEENSSEALEIPAAAKLMTALIASEQLKLDTMITISSVAAEIRDKAVDYGQTALKTGEKYSFEFLLLRMLFFDSDAAALALAEQISGEESKFVLAMNSKAQSLELTTAKFASSTGLPAESDVQDGPGQTLQLPSATISLRDLARLMLVVTQNKTLASAMAKGSEYLVLEGSRVIALHHQLEPIWTLAEGRVTGVFFSDRSGATTMTFGTSGDIPIVTIVQGGSRGQAIYDTLALYDAIDRTYEIAPLVEAGEHFFGGQEQTIDGETFGLIYLKSATYVRPVGQDYLDSAVQYQSFGPFSRPILSGVVVGQAIFKLLDGTAIAVDVGPDRQILSSVTLFDRALKQLQDNPNLTMILLATLSLLILVLAGKLIANLNRLFKMAFLLFFEIRSRR